MNSDFMERMIFHREETNLSMYVQKVVSIMCRPFNEGAGDF